MFGGAGGGWVKIFCHNILTRPLLGEVLFEKIILTLFWSFNFPCFQRIKKPFEPVHEISNNVVCATSKTSDHPAHTHSLIRAFAIRLSILPFGVLKLKRRLQRLV